MKSATRPALASIPLVFLLGLVFICAAVWLAWGMAAGLAGIGVSLLATDYFVVGSDRQ